MVSNPLCKTRNEFFRRLSEYKRVDSGCKLFNNVGGRVADKRAFLAECRFTIAFENESHPGYTREKVAEPMLVNTILIYWGDPLVGNDFDTRSLISFHDTPPGPGVSQSAALDLLVDRVVAVDRDPAVLAALVSRRSGAAGCGTAGWTGGCGTASDCVGIGLGATGWATVATGWAATVPGTGTCGGRARAVTSLISDATSGWYARPLAL